MVVRVFGYFSFKFEGPFLLTWTVHVVIFEQSYSIFPYNHMTGDSPWLKDSKGRKLWPG
jgi:hypothetical protein